MRKAIKYLVLSISSVVCFVLLVIMVGLLSDIESLSYPATLILPMISYLLLIGGLFVLTIWSFKFSNNEDHKASLIVSLSLLIASVIVFQFGRIVNAIIIQALLQ